MTLLHALARVTRSVRLGTQCCSSTLGALTAASCMVSASALQPCLHHQACSTSGFCSTSAPAAAWRCQLQQAPCQRAPTWCLHDTRTCTNTASSSGRSSSSSRCSSAARYSAAAQHQHAQELEPYRILVVTGNVRGAGTQLGAWVQLVGCDGESERFPVGNSAEDGLQRNSKVAFEVQVPRDIGAIRRVVVERAEGGMTETGGGWYLDHIEVEGPGNERLVFPCHSWFGPSDCGDFVGALERNLIPAVAEAELGTEGALAKQPVEVTASAIAFPHPDKVNKANMRGFNTKNFGYGGEDAYFFCTGKNNIFGCGVADGVYSWKNIGIDSGALSRTLMETAQHMVSAGYEDVYKVLQVAARHVESEGMQGSCTVCLLTINKAAGRLHAANLGDSGFFVLGVRPGGDKAEVKFRTSQMEHEFGRPFQLGHHKYASKPSDADLVNLPVTKGDTIVMGTDGLLDNLSETEILAEVVKQRSSGARPMTLVQSLAKAAFESSIDRRKVTPYAKAATEAFDMVFSGGKKDDITILVAYID